MNPLHRWWLRLFAAPRLDIPEDYEAVRRVQSRLGDRPLRRAEDLVLPVPGPVPAVPVRRFRPARRTRDAVVVYLHGGGWVTGDVRSHTAACAALADALGCELVSVDYRLAPEHPFPAGLEDCLGVVRRVLEEEAGTPVVLMGDSAGGNLAAAVCAILRDERRDERRDDQGDERRADTGAIAAQVLLYPVMWDDHDPATSPFPSVAEHGTGLRLTTIEIEDYMRLYVPDAAARHDPRVAPLRAEDFSDLPPTLVITAELDLLRDEGEEYAQRIAVAGGIARVQRVPDEVHGFITHPRFSRAVREAHGWIVDVLDEVLGPTQPGATAGAVRAPATLPDPPADPGGRR